MSIIVVICIEYLLIIYSALHLASIALGPERIVEVVALEADPIL